MYLAGRGCGLTLDSYGHDDASPADADDGSGGDTDNYEVFATDVVAVQRLLSKACARTHISVMATGLA